MTVRLYISSPRTELQKSCGYAGTTREEGLQKKKKWYMRIVFYCLDVAVINGWLLYRRHMEQKKVEKRAILPLRNFRASIGHALAKKAKLPRKRGRPSSSPPQPAKHPHATAATRPVEDQLQDQLQDQRICAASYGPLDSQELSVVNVTCTRACYFFKLHSKPCHYLNKTYANLVICQRKGCM